MAINKNEIPILEDIFQNGKKNNTEGIRYLSPSEILDKEPFVKGIKAIWVPTAGIINYVDVANKFAQLIPKINSDSKLFNLFEAQKISRDDNKKIVQTNLGDFIAEKVIVCSGLQSDRNAKKDNVKLDMQIVGFRGDYYEFYEHAKHKINNLVYPVPNPKYPFLGVHFTRMIDGSLECGPNAVFSFKREGRLSTVLLNGLEPAI